MKKLISVFGSIGLQVEYQEKAMNIGIGGRGYDMALAFSVIQEQCIFCTSVHPGSFSDFIVMDAEENNIQLWADRDNDVSFSGTVRIHDGQDGSRVYHAHPTMEKGINKDLVDKVISMSKAVVAEGAFSLSFLKDMAVECLKQSIPFFIIVRAKEEIQKLNHLPEKSFFLIAGPFVESLSAPGIKQILSLKEGLVMSSGGKVTYISSDEIIDPVFTRSSRIQAFNMVFMASILINQMVSWGRTMKLGINDCMASLLTEAVSEQWDTSLSIDRKFAKYFRQTDNIERDFLTGARTRSFMEHNLEAMASNDNPFSIIVASVDNMAEINQNHGHISGDSRLVAVSREIKNCLQDHDILGRWNGSEFVMILPGSDLSTAMKIAERIRRNIVSNLQENPPVVLSVGISEKEVIESWKSTLERAWSHLQDAKTMGKNHVVFKN